MATLETRRNFTQILAGSIFRRTLLSTVNYFLISTKKNISSFRSKIPHLMNVSLEPIISQGDTKAARALGFTTRKPWDPLTASHMNILRQKLGHSNMPFIVCVPSRPSLPKNPPQLRRMRFWHTQLGSFGKIQNIPTSSTNDLSFHDYVDQMVKTTRNHVLDLHVSFFLFPNSINPSKSSRGFIAYRRQAITPMLYQCILFQLHLLKMNKNQI